jgi:sRNA-binding carbon storage regulator CsrA
MGLILQRCVGQEIVVGGNVVIRINKMERREDGADRVWLDIVAPRDVTVDRREIYESKERAKNGL